MSWRGCEVPALLFVRAAKLLPLRYERLSPERHKGKTMPSRKPPLFTIGYEKATSPAVLGGITDAKIDVLVDVRAVAVSRRPGFSKRQLAAGLDEYGVGYLHLRGLGTPKEGRLAARAGKIDELHRIFDKHLKTAQARE